MSRARQVVAAALALLAAVALLWAAAIQIAGGVNTTIAGHRVSSNSVWRPLAAAVLCAASALALAGTTRARAAAGRVAAACTPARAALAFAAATVVIGLAGNSWTASGPDSYAYVSQAELWRSGTLQLRVPLAAEVPWPNAIATFATPGYRPAPDGAAALVPVTAPGLPLAMAVFQTIGGHAAAFVITPLAGGALVLLTFLIGRRVDTPRTGLIAAWLVATSPAVLYMLMWPMTDIPTAAITALMVWCLIGGSTSAAFVAGLAAAAGLLVRPNFSVIAAAAWVWLVADAVWLMRGRAPWTRLVAFTVAAIPGQLAVMLINVRWYGSAFASGYGNVSGLLSIDRVVTNLERYLGWLAGSSPIAIAGLVVLALPLSRLWPSAASRRVALLFLLTTGAAWSVYLFYGAFEDWWYLRFLLPAWPAMFIAASVLIGAIWTRGRASKAIALALVLGAGVSGLVIARDRWVFNLGATERRYAAIAHLVDRYTEPDAVILTSQHAGTIRYYAGRETLRFDFLDDAWLDRAVAWLAARGRHPYVLVEDWEQPLFESRFQRTSELAHLAFPPIFAWRSKYTPGDVRLYDPFRRDGETADPGPTVEDALPRAAAPMTR
jgi:hypothetical protein